SWRQSSSRVFARAREAARRTGCLSNMKQVTTGILMYSQDYDEVFPFQGLPDPCDFATSKKACWINSTMPYVKNKQVWYCPSAGRHLSVYLPPEFHLGRQSPERRSADPRRQLPVRGRPRPLPHHQPDDGRVGELLNPYTSST